MIPKLQKPIQGEAPITFKFGEAPKWYKDVFHCGHNGVDFGVKEGTPVMACGRGVVSYADYIPDTDGCGVILKHTWGLSLYWHLKQIIAKIGDEKEKADLIGFSGATGFVTGPHLHFGIKSNEFFDGSINGWVDPLVYIADMGEIPNTPLIEPRQYIVRPFDSLWSIAEKFYKNGAYWRKIYEANSHKIKDPGLIYPLQILLIP